jgi:lipopolysaccharide/colanic/teichoic acid biosynthesis glycosyltransferase
VRCHERRIGYAVNGKGRGDFSRKSVLEAKAPHRRARFLRASSIPASAQRIAEGVKVLFLEGFVFKRSVDISLAAILLVLSLPSLAVAAIAIKLDSSGPVLFCQPRMGRNFRLFRILKLRTMHIKLSGPAYTLGRDPRITRIGRLLRWLKVDELPQLWNVLCGDMSLVGPRPVVPALAMEFCDCYTRLLKVRPGLTDPASLKYYRENDLLDLLPDPRNYFNTVIIPDKLRLSEAYLERANVWTDLGMMAATGFVLAAACWRSSSQRLWPFKSAKTAEIKFP